MSLPTTSVWEVRPTNGSDTNGGGFNSAAAGTDYSKQNSKNTVGSNISTTDLSTTTTGGFTATSATAAFTSAITGNFIYLSGGTGGTVTSGWYLATFATSTTITLDRSPGATATLVTMNIGGALKTITQLNTNMAAGHVAWVKAESTITTATAITFNFTSGGSTIANGQSFIAGYTTTRGDGGQFTVQATAGSITVIQIANNNNLNTFTLRNLIIDCNSQSATTGIATQSYGNTLENIQVKNYSSGTAFDISQGGSQGIVLRKCLAYNGTGTSTKPGFNVTANLLGTVLIDCAVLSQTGGLGFIVNGGCFIRCIAGNISGASSDGWDIQGNSQGPTVLDGCIGYNCGRDGFRFISAAFGNYGISLQNCIAYGNVNKDFNNTLTTIPSGGIYFDYNAYGIAPVGLTVGPNCQTLSSDPFVAGASNNFAPV